MLPNNEYKKWGSVMNIHTIGILLALIAVPYVHAEDKWNSKLPSDDKKALTTLDDAVLNYATKGKDNYTKASKQMNDRINKGVGVGKLFGGIGARERLMYLRTDLRTILKDANGIAVEADKKFVTDDLNAMITKVDQKFNG
jgi:hypothetical protein